VIGATLNKTGAIRFEATRVGRDTALASIVRMVGDAQATKLPIQRLVDQVAGVFVPAVIIVALIAFVAWYDLGPTPAFAYAVIVAVTVLIIACPCALGLATPTSLTVGMGKGAEQGVLFRGGDALQAARRLDTVVLDKTGTITHGKPALTDVIVAPGFADDDVLALAAAVERSSEHPARPGHRRRRHRSQPAARRARALQCNPRPRRRGDRQRPRRAARQPQADGRPRDRG
jgi:Cu+-exporting ATPase